MKIYHHTNPVAYDLIARAGYLDLEGCNAKRGWDSQNRQQRRSIYRLLGRHVWFTSAQRCATASGDQMCFVFDSDRIGAVRWSVYRERFRRSRDRWACVEALEESARTQGDDPDDYFVIDRPVRLDQCLDHPGQ